MGGNRIIETYKNKSDIVSGEKGLVVKSRGMDNSVYSDGEYVLGSIDYKRSYDSDALNRFQSVVDIYNTNKYSLTNDDIYPINMRHRFSGMDDDYVLDILSTKTPIRYYTSIDEDKASASPVVYDLDKYLYVDVGDYIYYGELTVYFYSPQVRLFIMAPLKRDWTLLEIYQSEGSYTDLGGSDPVYEYKQPYVYKLPKMLFSRAYFECAFPENIGGIPWFRNKFRLNFDGYFVLE